MIQNEQNGLTIEWKGSSFEVLTLEKNQQQYNQINIPNANLTVHPGHPQLPFFSTLIGLPPTGQVTWKIIDLEEERLNLTLPVLPAPQPQPFHLATFDYQDSSDNLLPQVTSIVEDPTIYQKNAFYPTAIIQVDTPQQWREHRLSRLTIHPVQVNPTTGEVKIVRRIRFQLTFEEPASTTNTAYERNASNAPVDTILAKALLNPQAINWTPPPIRPQLKNILPPLSSTKVIINKTGMYALTYADLLAAGLPLETLDPGTLTLTHGPQHTPIAITIEGEADGHFDPADRLLFYAQSFTNRFSQTDVYWLSYGTNSGLRMTQQDGQPNNLPAGIVWQTLWAEENHFYDSLYPTQDGDHWYWSQLRSPTLTQTTHTFSLTAPLTNTQTATLTVWLQGFTNPPQNPDHHLQVYLNLTHVGETMWNGSQMISLTLPISTNLLQADDNQLTLVIPGLEGVTVEGLWLDAFELIYPSQNRPTQQLLFESKTGLSQYTFSTITNTNLNIYDITQPTNPQQVTDYTLSPDTNGYTLAFGNNTTTTKTYLIVPEYDLNHQVSFTTPKTIDPPDTGADYIIISPSSLLAGITSLAEHRAARGLRVASVDLAAIYDTYGAGNTSPEAIRAFLEDAYQTWATPAPSYVLLVGDGSYDFKNHTGWQPSNLLPPYLANVDPWLGETASDNQLVTLTGDDTLPDLMIGRLPVNSVAELETVVNKIIAYETNPYPGDWNAYHLFVADNPDAAGDFHLEADAGYGYVEPPFMGRRFYYTPQPLNGTFVYSEAETLRQSFLTRFNQGAGMVSYHGHSSWHQWGVEQFLRWNRDTALNDISQLHNGGRLPVVLEMTCFTGYFHHPEYPTLDESLLLQPGGGAIAIWGATGLGVGTGHQALYDGFYQTIMEENQPNLGLAVLNGKLNLYQAGFHQDLLDTFTLLGDPALTLNKTIIPFEQHLYLPLVLK